MEGAHEIAVAIREVEIAIRWMSLIMALIGLAFAFRGAK